MTVYVYSHLKNNGKKESSPPDGKISSFVPGITLRGTCEYGVFNHNTLGGGIFQCYQITQDAF